MNFARVISLLSILAVPVAFAAETTPHPFPSDYTPHPCAATAACGKTFSHSELAGLGQRMFGLSISLDWVMAHEEELRKELAPKCTRIGTCYAVPGNSFQFCNDYMVGEMRTICDRYTDANDRQQCSYYIEMWMLGVDTHSIDVWKEAQKCSEEKMPGWKSDVAPTVWVEPARIPPGYNGIVKIYSLDTTTKVPVQSGIQIGDQIIYAKSNPNGRVESYYGFKWPIKLVRAKRADGHEDVVAPMITVTNPRYPQVTLRMPYDVPTLKVEMTPAAAKLRNGKNTVTIKATDAVSGKPVEMRVMAGDRVAGDTNVPFELTLGHGKRPEIWLTSLFDAYSDVVVAPAR